MGDELNWDDDITTMTLYSDHPTDWNEDTTNDDATVPLPDIIGRIDFLPPPPLGAIATQSRPARESPDATRPSAFGSWERPR